MSEEFAKAMDFWHIIKNFLEFLGEEKCNGSSLWKKLVTTPILIALLLWAILEKLQGK